MKVLKQYKKNGFSFDIIERDGEFAIAKGVRGSGVVSFEVITIRQHNGLNFGDRTTEPAEYPPSNTEWGSKGWTYRSIEMARDKFYELANP